MIEPGHPLEGNKSIFIRYRNGFTLYVQPDIIDKLKILVRILENEADYKKVFNNLIEDIKDGSGYGIHPNSTWFSCVKEIFESYNRFDKLDSETKNVLTKLLKILLASTKTETTWDKQIKPFLLNNIEILSRWNIVKQHRGSFFGVIKRDKNGEYYLIENKKRVSVLGPKTLDEERFDYITDDALRSHGLLGQIFRLVSLADITYQYQHNKKIFSDRIACVLPDNDYSSAYLHWQWRILGVYDYLPAFWKPRSCFSDPEWLAYDLLSSYAEITKLHKEPHPEIIGENEITRFNEAFKGFPVQYNIALETDLYLGDDPEVYFDFEGRKIRWLNGTKFVYPILVVPSKSEECKDAIEISKRFLSLLVKEAQIPIVAKSNASSVSRIRPILKYPKSIGGLGLDPKYLLTDDISQFSKDKWYGLAFYKEGVNSNSIYYSFLSFYKVIELAFKRKDKDVFSWIDNNIDKAIERVSTSWKTEVLLNNKKASSHLYGSDRCAIAHISNKKGAISSPDNADDHMRVQKDLPIIRQLAEMIFEQKIL